MNWVFFAAFIVATSAAKLGRTYLPPASAALAGGSPGSLQAPLAKSESQSLPVGSFINEHDGVVVDVAPVGTRASQSGLGGPRLSYGSTNSKVGDAAFRGTQQNPSKIINKVPAALDSNPDLSAFHQPSKPSRTSFQISRDSGAHITKYHNEINKDRFSYSFEADNGIKAEEKGVASNGVQAEGGFSYVGDDGKVYSVAYTADTNGYRPVGSHLPTPPPIPQEILRALEKNSRDEAAGLSEDGSYDAKKYNTGDYTQNDANGKYNDSQTIKFSIRPESRPNISSASLNKNQGALAKPNTNGALQGTKDNKPDFPKNLIQISGLSDNLFNRNSFNQGQMNVNAGITTRNELSQHNLQGSVSPNLDSSVMNKDSSSSSMPPKPLSQQDLQEPIIPGQDNPSSYDTSFSTIVSDNVLSKPNMQSVQQSVANSDLEGKKKQNSFNTQGFNNQMTQSLNNRFSTLQSSTGTFNSFGLNQDSANNIGITSTSSFFPATKEPERILTTPFESFTTINNAKLPTTFGLRKGQNTGSNFDSGLTSTSKFTSIPTTQQEFKTKTTPQTQFTSTNYSDLKVTDSPFSFFSQASQNVDRQTQQYKPSENKLQAMSQFSSIPPNSINFSQSTQDPNLVKSTEYNQGLDTVAFFNKPSKPLSVDSAPTEINAQKYSSTSSDKFNSGFDTNLGTTNSDESKDFTSTTYSQGANGFNRQSNSPTLPPISQTIVSGNKGSNGITQASISPFSSFFSNPLNLKESNRFTLKPIQETTQTSSQSQTQALVPSKITSIEKLQSSFTNQDYFNENSNSQTQQYENQIYEYNKPLPSTFGNVASTPLGHIDKQFTMTTPFRMNEMQTNSPFGQQNMEKKTTPLQYQPSTQFNNKQTTSSIENTKDVTGSQTQDKENTSQFQIYEYTKPLQSLTSVSPNENLNKNKNQQIQFNNREQFNMQSTIAYTGSYTDTIDNFQKEAQATTQFDQEEFERKTEMPEFSQTASTFDSSIYQYTKPVQSFITTSKQDYSNNLPEPQRKTTVGVMSTNFGHQYSNAQEVFSQTPQDRFNSKQSTTSQFTIQGNQPTTTQFINTFSKPFPSISEQLGNKFNSENRENIGEIYNYQKPNQTLSSSEQMAKPLDKEQSMSISSGSQLVNSYNSQERPNQNSELGEIYEYSKPAQTLTTPARNNVLDQNRNQILGQRFDQVSSQPNIFDQNLSGDISTTQNDQISSTSFVTQTNTNSDDMFTKPDRTTVTQSSFTSGINSKPTGTRPQFVFQSACCRGFQTQKHQESQVTQSSFKNTLSSDLKSNQNFEAQKLTTQGLITTGEDFGGPRKPPGFDDKGYHY